MTLSAIATPASRETPALQVPQENAERPYAIYLDAMRQCESGGDDFALNKMDVDGTPSYGRYQFKPKTLYLYATKYEILTDIEPKEIMNHIYDGELQEQVFVAMIENGVQLSREFPACHARHKSLLRPRT